MTRFIRVPLLAVAVLGILSGCVLFTLPTSLPVAEETGPVIADHVTVDTDGIVLVAADGSELVFDYFESDPADVVAALTIGFGFDPGAISLPAGGVRYSWGSFELTDREVAAEFPVFPRFVVRVFDDHAGEVPVFLGDSAQVGAPPELLGSDVVILSEHPVSHEILAEWHPVPVDPATVGVPADTNPALVTLVSWNAQLPWITDFSAPVPSW